MKKTKILHRITEDQIDSEIIKKFPGKVCPSCGKPGLCAGAIETEYMKRPTSILCYPFPCFVKVAIIFTGHQTLQIVSTLSGADNWHLEGADRSRLQRALIGLRKP